MDSSDGESDSTNEQSKLKTNSAWADAIAKVMRQKKTSNKHAIILSKAKKIVNVKQKKPELGFEIVGQKDISHSEEDDEIEDKKPIIGKKLVIKEYQTKGRVKPSVIEKNRERTLMKIATKGVVQLFNAVRQQQKTVDKTLKKAGKSHFKREKMMDVIDKNKFLEVLTSSIKSIPVDNDIKEETENDELGKTWDVLNDNFMMGSRLKDWDKEEDN